MSLGITIMVEEGLVIAAESLGTLLKEEVKTITGNCKCGHKGVPAMACPKCKAALGPLPPVLQKIPTSHTHYCQKLFKINDLAGMILVGSPYFDGKKIQQCVYGFIEWLAENKKHKDDVEDMVKNWNRYVDATNLLKGKKDRSEIMFAGLKLKGGIIPFSQTVVFDKTSISVLSPSSYGIAVIGVHEILDKMFEGGGIHQYAVKDFPLQDAVEFAEFLMQTQIGVDKYTNRFPRVGGDIDIAVIHPVYGFKWVKQKSLQKLLES